MKSKLFYALIGTLVCAGAALALSGGVLLTTKNSKELSRLAEKTVLAPGRAVAEKIQGARIRRSASEGLEKLTDSKLVEEIRESRAAERIGGLAHSYNVGVWTLAGFALCFVMAILLGVSSLVDAVALGFKVMATLFFLQAGFLIYCWTTGCKFLQ